MTTAAAPAPPVPPGADWRLWADATCAGLSALVPIPLLDLAFERFFRRRIPRAVAKVRGVALDPQTNRTLGRRFGSALIGGCLGVPITVGRSLLRSVWHKVIYVLAVADSASLISEYWHRAYLIDHLARAGYLAPDVDRAGVLRTFEQALREADTSPLKGVARQVVGRVRHGLRLLLRARREGAALATEPVAELVRARWMAGADRSLIELAARFDELYRGMGEVDSTTEAQRHRDRT